MYIITRFHLGGPLFLKRFSEGFFSQKWCQMEPKMASKMTQNLIKNELETKSTKNAVNLLPSDLQETRFRMEWLSKITKTRGADKYKKISKNCAGMKPKSMKNRSRDSTKNEAQKQSSKNRKILKKYLQNGCQKVTLYPGKCLLAHLWWSKPFL